LSAVSAAFALQPQREIIALFQRGRAGHKILKKSAHRTAQKSKLFAFCHIWSKNEYEMLNNISRAPFDQK